MTNKPFITISIVSHGDKEKINFLINSLLKHEPNIEQLQLILTDNLEHDLPDLDPSPWASLHILRNHRPLGFAENHNKAFELTQGKYFAILNPDLISEHPVFDRLIDHIKNHQADLIAPHIIDEGGMVQDSFRTLPSPFSIIRRRMPGYRFHAQPPDKNGLIYPDWIAGMFWLMKSDIYRKLGGMDERYRLYFEDVDFCTRARLMGLKIAVDTRSRVQHDAKRSSRRKLYYLYLHIKSAFRFFTSSVYRQAKIQ